MREDCNAIKARSQRLKNRKIGLWVSLNLMICGKGCYKHSTGNFVGSIQKEISPSGTSGQIEANPRQSSTKKESGPWQVSGESLTRVLSWLVSLFARGKHIPSRSTMVSMHTLFLFTNPKAWAKVVPCKLTMDVVLHGNLFWTLQNKSWKRLSRHLV